jgi:hypothetical protein
VSSGDSGGVTAITNDHIGGLVHQMFELEDITLIGWREVQSGQLVLVINSSMELKAIVPALPVLAELGDAFGNSVSVGSNEPTDW